MKILHLVTDLSQTGGDYIYARSMISHLATQNRGEMTFHIAEIQSHGTGRNLSVYNDFERMGVQFHEVPKLGESTTFPFHVAEQISQIVDAHGVDIIHTHTFISDLIAVLVKLGSQDYLAQLNVVIGGANRSLWDRIVLSGQSLAGSPGNNLLYLDTTPMDRSVDRGLAPSPKLKLVSTKHQSEFKSLCYNHQLGDIFPLRRDVDAAANVNREMQRFVSEREDYVITIGNDAYLEWSRQNPSTGYIPVSVIDENIQPRQYDEADDVGTHYIFAGRISGTKKPDLLVESFCSHLDEFPDDTLTIVGEGVLLGECKKIAGTRKGIVFRGHLSRDQLFQEMALANALCLFSLQEGQPLVVQEAMCVGLAILATGVGTILEMVSDGESGILIDRVTKATIMGALRRFSSMPRAEQAAMGRISRERTRTIGSAAASFHKHAELYRRLAS